MVWGRRGGGVVWAGRWRWMRRGGVGWREWGEGGRTRKGIASQGLLNGTSNLIGGSSSLPCKPPLAETKGKEGRQGQQQKQEQEESKRKQGAGNRQGKASTTRGRQAASCEVPAAPCALRTQDRVRPAPAPSRPSSAQGRGYRRARTCYCNTYPSSAQGRGGPYVQTNKTAHASAATYAHRWIPAVGYQTRSCAAIHRPMRDARAGSGSQVLARLVCGSGRQVKRN